MTPVNDTTSANDAAKPTRRSLLRFVTTTIFLAVVIVGCTLGGMALGLYAGSNDHYKTSFGSLESRVRPDLKGHVTVYVPLVDWRVQLLENPAPARIDIELRGIDRDQAGRGISSATAASRTLEDVRGDSERVIRQTIQRAVIVAAIGGFVGAAIAGLLITSFRLRRRWLVISPLIGAGLIALVIVPSVQAMSSLAEQHVQVTSAGGHADELPVVLRFAEQLLDVGPEYERHYATALRSVVNLAGFAGDGSKIEPDSTAIVISDLHDNVFVLDALDEYAGDSPVFGIGDFIQVGARIEQATAPKVARLGSEMIAVSGNHDTPEYMRALADAGATVLDAEAPTTTVDDMLVAGWPDPLERSESSRGEHRLRVYGSEYKAQREAFVEWWDALEERPDIVMVHQHGFAHYLADHLKEIGDTKRLVILTGHDHIPHVHADGPHVIVDAGTMGAGGLAAIGEQEASFAQLEFTDGHLSGVLLISIEPLTGNASRERVDIPASTRRK